MIESILPPGVAAEEAFTDLPGVVLFPEEEAVVAQAAEGRRREFATVRACARAALARIDVPPGPILPGRRGAPRWPAGVVGSITHCAGYRACAVARRDEILGIGLDAEPHERLPDGVLRAIALADEQDRLSDLATAEPGWHWGRILFSAKESVYKAWFPLTRRWLGFKDVSVTIDAAAGTFAARVLVDAPQVNGADLTGFEGRWLVGRGAIVTAIVLPARRRTEERTDDVRTRAPR